MIKENIYGHKKRLMFIVKAIEKYRNDNKLRKRDIRILDVGCGTGLMITQPLAEMGYKVLGIDLNESGIEVAKNNNKYINNCNYKCIDLKNLKLKYDIVICSEVLEHLTNPDLLLTQIRKKLKKNGFSVITVPNGYGCFEIDDYFWKLFFNRGQKKDHIRDAFVDQSGHVQHFTLNKIEKIIQENRFIIERKSGATIFSGKIIDSVFGHFKISIDANIFISKFLPIWILSGWYFLLSKNEKE